MSLIRIPDYPGQINEGNFLDAVAGQPPEPTLRIDTFDMLSILTIISAVFVIMLAVVVRIVRHRGRRKK